MELSQRGSFRVCEIQNRTAVRLSNKSTRDYGSSNGQLLRLSDQLLGIVWDLRSEEGVLLVIEINHLIEAQLICSSR